MTLAQLRHLLAIVDAEMNITIAARRLNSTQPGLSRQLKLLEEELGTQIFDRQGRNLRSLTEFGCQVVESARAIMGEVATVKALAATAGTVRPSQLRIATTHTQARLLLPVPLATLKHRYPDLAVQLFSSGTHEAIEMVDTGAADLALVSNVVRPTERDICVPLYRWHLAGLLPRETRLAFRDGRPTIGDLAGVPLVTYDSLLEREASFAEVFRQAGVEPRIAFTAGDSDTVKTYVRAGMGLGILAEFAIADRDDDLRVIDLKGLFPARITWAVIQRQPAIPKFLIDALQLIVPGLDVRSIERGKADSIVPLDWEDMGFPPTAAN